MKDTNPFDLKVLAKAPKDYLDTDEFFDFLVKKIFQLEKIIYQDLLIPTALKYQKRRERVQVVQSLLFIKYQLSLN